MRASPPLADIVASLEARGVVLPNGTARLGFYGNSESMSDHLVGLICDGRKRATSSLSWAYERDVEPLPAPGDIEIVLDYNGRPAAILSITNVAVLPFSDVSATFAAAEGEGGRAGGGWGGARGGGVAGGGGRVGRSPSSNMPVVCSEFEWLRVRRSGAA
jgi:uncharacterized protein YhfF